MKPGAYVFCRPIDGFLPLQHQFVVLVPAAKESLSGFVKDIAGVQCAVLGAFNVMGFLRARLFAPSDVGFLQTKIANPEDPTVQSSKVELQACLVGTEDPFLACICRSYRRYRATEGTKDEISYPAGPMDHLSSSQFNSNSWAQSLLYWSEMMFVPGKCIRDFNGMDVGNERLIPRKYFLT